MFHVTSGTFDNVSLVLLIHSFECVCNWVSFSHCHHCHQHLLGFCYTKWCLKLPRSYIEQCVFTLIFNLSFFSSFILYWEMTREHVMHKNFDWLYRIYFFVFYHKKTLHMLAFSLVWVYIQIEMEHLNWNNLPRLWFQHIFTHV